MIDEHMICCRHIMPAKPRPQGPHPRRDPRARRPAVPAARLCRHQHRRHHAGGRPDARRLLCPLHLEGRSVRRDGPGRPRAAGASCAAGAAGGRARRLSRQGRSRRRLRWAAPWPPWPATSPARPLAAQLAYANVLHGAIGELARGRRRKLDADATAAAILAVGAVDPRPRLGRHGGSATGCCAAPGGRRRPLPQAAASFAKAETIDVTPESRWRSSFHTRCTITRWSGRSFTKGAFFWIQAISLSGLANLLSWKRQHDRLLAGIDPVDAGGAAEQLERHGVQQELDLRRHLAEAVDQFGGEGVDLAPGCSSAADAAIEPQAHRRGRRRTPPGSAPECRD